MHFRLAYYCKYYASDVRTFIFISNFLFLWKNGHKVQRRKFCTLRHQNGRKLKSKQIIQESNTNYNCKTKDFLELRHLFTSKIADNYICIFTLLSYLNNLSLHENVSSYLLVAHLELEIACISQSFFIHSKIDIGKQMLQTS